MKKLFYNIIFLLCYSNSLLCCSVILKIKQPQFSCIETDAPSRKEYKDKEALLQEKITQLEFKRESMEEKQQSNKKTSLLDAINMCLQKKKYHKEITLILQQLIELQKQKSQYTGCSFSTNNKHELIAHINKEHPNTQRFHCSSCGDNQLYSLHPGFCPVIHRNEPITRTCRAIKQ